MFATIEAVSSARHLNRLCTRDLPYMWICGRVGVNYHMLSDFRTGHGGFLDQLLTDTIATLMYQNVVTLETVAQDGMRVRASAGSGSFRREKTLKECRQEAAGQVQLLREESENESDNDASNARQKAAKEGAARERLDAALKNLVELHEDVCERYGKVPDNYIVDGGFSTNDDITQVEHSGSQVVAPMTHEDRILKRGGDPHERRQGDSEEMAAFRERKKSDESKSLLEERPSIAEFPNAECRNRGLHQFRVRGLQKVRTSSLWYALTFNFMRMIHLGAIPA
jgi:hypothetical protein